MSQCWMDVAKASTPLVNIIRRSRREAKTSTSSNPSGAAGWTGTLVNRPKVITRRETLLCVSFFSSLVLARLPPFYAIKGMITSQREGINRWLESAFSFALWCPDTMDAQYDTIEDAASFDIYAWTLCRSRTNPWFPSNPLLPLTTALLCRPPTPPRPSKLL